MPKDQPKKDYSKPALARREALSEVTAMKKVSPGDKKKLETN